MVVEHIRHQGCATLRGKEVIMVKASEGTGHHRVAKVVWTVKDGDRRGESLRDTEVAGLPGHLFIEFNQPFRFTADGFFMLLGHRNRVQINATGKVEAAFNRGLNE